MPTGPKHYQVHGPGEADEWSKECHCTIDKDHDDKDEPMSNYLSVSEAGDIRRSSGIYEDYTFGYNGDELGSTGG